jgi:hypothetical protein
MLKDEDLTSSNDEERETHMDAAKSTISVPNLRNDKYLMSLTHIDDFRIQIRVRRLGSESCDSRREEEQY